MAWAFEMARPLFYNGAIAFVDGCRPIDRVYLGDADQV